MKILRQNTEKKTEKAIVRHNQTIRQSANYNSAEASYGVELVCDNDKESIANAFKRAEQFVESQLEIKFREQRKLLNVISSK